MTVEFFVRIVWTVFEKNEKVPKWLFLVGAFSRKEKARLLQWAVFFSAYNLTLNGPLFLQFLQN